MMSIIVIGAGLAGGTAVTALREQGYDGKVTLYGAEPHLPYERPPYFFTDQDDLGMEYVGSGGTGLADRAAKRADWSSREPLSPFPTRFDVRSPEPEIPGLSDHPE